MASGTCLYCGLSFTAQRSTKKFCDASCRIAYHRQEKRILEFSPDGFSRSHLYHLKIHLEDIANHPRGKMKAVMALEKLRLGVLLLQKQFEKNHISVQKTLFEDSCPSCGADNWHELKTTVRAGTREFVRYKCQSCKKNYIWIEGKPMPQDYVIDVLYSDPKNYD